VEVGKKPWYFFVTRDPARTRPRLILFLQRGYFCGGAAVVFPNKCRGTPFGRTGRSARFPALRVRDAKGKGPGQASSVSEASNRIFRKVLV
jgi:hypothetical protein